MRLGRIIEPVSNRARVVEQFISDDILVLKADSEEEVFTNPLDTQSLKCRNGTSTWCTFRHASGKKLCLNIAFTRQFLSTVSQLTIIFTRTLTLTVAIVRVLTLTLTRCPNPYTRLRLSLNQLLLGQSSVRRVACSLNHEVGTVPVACVTANDALYIDT